MIAEVMSYVDFTNKVHKLLWRVSKSSRAMLISEANLPTYHYGPLTDRCFQIFRDKDEGRNHQVQSRKQIREVFPDFNKKQLMRLHKLNWFQQ